jgi:predicted kinase
MLVALSGLPGVGKTTIGKALARASGATYLRIDSIEDALRKSGGTIHSEGYDVAHAIAEDNLCLGRIVIADCVNPWPLTRDAWTAVARRARVTILEVEITCSDEDEHRRRVETRLAQDPSAPSWEQVTSRDYRAWTRDRVVIDSCTRPLEVIVDDLKNRLSSCFG